ncbi:guanine nucleotide binding protein, alpha subunit [Entophlyctis helioformis]|nr:guanine nucleotide binding protein, alpha subunit [Entophlyctis helioformis]
MAATFVNLEQLRHAKLVSDRIDAELELERQQLIKARNDPKLLILGSGDSGKTTFLKNIQLALGGGFSAPQREVYRQQMLSNIVESAKGLVAACDALGLDLVSGHAAERDTVLSYLHDGTSRLPDGFTHAVSVLWATHAMQAAWCNAHKFKIQDTADYFLSAAVAMGKETYTPTDIDILHIRHATTAISEYQFMVEGRRFRFFDVAGQRGFRKQWASHFDGVHAMLFITSLAGFDQMLDENPAVNRMMDALQLFEEICNNALLCKASMILFLNKKDLFERKLKHSNMSDHFPDYQGRNEYTPVLSFVQRKFMGKKLNPEKSLYVHTTCCTNQRSTAFLVASIT